MNSRQEQWTSPAGDPRPLQGAEAIRTWLCARVAAAAGLDVGEVDPQAPFNSFGMGSKEAVVLSGELEDAVGRPVSPMIVYDFPSIAALAEHLSLPNETGDDRLQQPYVAGEALAILGMACRFPGAEDTDGFWEMIRSGASAIDEVPSDRWDAAQFYSTNPEEAGKMNTRWGGFIAGIDQFDAHFFGISPREAESMDPQQRLVLESAWHALEDAGIPTDRLRGSKTGVFIGASNYDYSRMLLRNRELLDAYCGTGNAGSVAANRLSYLLDLHGVSMTVDTACSSALVAMHLAIQSLRSGESDLAIVGGVNAILSPELNITFSHARMMSPEGRCKSFDAGADGYVRAEGCGVVVIKRLKEALRDRDAIRAVIRGSAVNQDGRTNGLTAPNAGAQEEVIRAALRNAAVRPEEMQYAEAHGTGTPLGDPIEVRALKAVLSSNQRRQPCFLGSVKSNIGHLESAAGISGVIKTILCLEHREIPPLAHFEKLNPYIEFEGSGFEIPRQSQAWPPNGASGRLAGVSSFGFGGTNAHIILEEAPERQSEKVVSERPAHIFTLSARSSAALGELAQRYISHIDLHPELRLPDFCYSANTGRTHFTHRLALVCDSMESLRKQLSSYVEDVAKLTEPEAAQTYHAPRIAFLYAGQGSQYVGMGRELFESQPVFRHALENCDAILRNKLRQPLLDVLFQDNGDSSLDHTEYTQPALFAFEYALTQLWASWGIRPAAVLGHSIGEYAAACAAGVLSLEDALTLVAERGRLMQELPPGGVMTSLSGPVERVMKELESYAGSVSLSAVNGPASVVISGEKNAVDKITEALQGEGFRSQPLRVSHAFHSPLMESILPALKECASQRTARPAQIALISNLTGGVLGEAPDASYWSSHAREPVQFQKGIETTAALGCRVLLEIGPGATLLGMGRLCLPEAGYSWMVSLRKGNSQQILQTLASLYTLGAEVDWKGFDGEYQRTRLRLAPYPFQKKRYWSLAANQDGDASGSGRVGTPAHPLLGWRLRSPLNIVGFENTISANAPVYLRDHQVFGAVVFPAAAWLEMALAAGGEALQHKPAMVSNLAVLEPLAISGKGETILQTLYTPEGHDSGQVEMFSLCTQSATQPERWKLHSRAKIRACESDPVREESGWLANVESRCTIRMAAGEVYELLQGIGLQYGPAFRKLDGIWTGDGEALGLIREAAPHETRGYAIEPTILDACFQTLAAALAGPGLSAGVGSSWLPAAIGRFHILRPRTAVRWCHAVLQPLGDARLRTILMADLELADATGSVVARIDSLELRRVSQQMLQGATAVNSAGSFYSVRWKTVPASTSVVDSRGQRWLIFASADAVGEKIVAEARSRGIDVAVILAGDERAHRGDISQINPERAEDYRWVLNEQEKLGHTITQIVNMWPTEIADPSPNEEVAESSARLGCRSALLLSQAVAANPPGTSLRISFLTRGAQPVQKAQPVSAIQASLWGFVRTLALERPDLQCLLADLDPEMAEATVKQLVDELAGNIGEGEVAFRGGDRYVARIDSLPAAAAEPSGQVQLIIENRGILENLKLEKLSRRTPEPGQIEIRVHAAGLNFRDVVNALGMYPGEPGPLGGECAGEVVAVGSGVDGLREGDQVFAIAPGSFADYVLTDSKLAVSKPTHLSYEEAAGLPIAFLTAHYGLAVLGHIKAGDRILIHVATGGVGLAALQIAKRAGAEVFATAGSPAKRKMLADLGIKHVMNSRTLEFAEEVLAQTDGRGVDLILNSLSGEFIPQNLRCLATGGRFLEIGKIGIWSLEQMTAARPDVQYFPFDLAALCRDDSALIQQLLLDVRDCFESGEMRPLPVTTFALKDAVEAFRYMAQAKHTGKIVLTCAKSEKSGETVHAAATYLITGGLGGLGLAAARWLIEKGARNLVLVGRTPPAERVQSELAKLRESGANITTVTADVSRMSEVKVVIENIRKNGPPLRGILHAAGVLSDSPLHSMSPESIETVAAAKVGGAWNLHNATHSERLDWFILFSSAAALLGSPGQANYSAANAFLDAFAHHRQRMGLAGTSVAWGPWDNIGMTKSMDQGIVRRWAAAGVQPIPVEEGFAMLEHALAKELPYVAIIPGDWASMQSANGPAHGSGRYADLIGANQSSNVAADGFAAKIRKAAPDARRAMLMNFLRDRLRRTLGLEAGFPIDSDQPLNELGIDSLMALELKNALSSELGLALSATLIFEYPTLDALCTFLTSATGTEQPPQPSISETVQTENRDLESVLAEIESLPEAQAKEYADR